jgi:hypothetical protein
MWQEWGHLVAPLDDSPDWRGLVHYNAACSLALSGNPDSAVAELRRALTKRPSLTAWSKQDADLQSLHEMPEYQELYAPEHWWQAMEASPQAEAFADQFMRTLAMCREAVEAFPAVEWCKGDSLYQRPAGLALHLAQTLHGYCAITAEESGEEVGLGADWQDKGSARLPSQGGLLAYLDKVERRVARFLVEADLADAEERFPWTGSTLMGRAAYMLRHTQHHLAEMCLELHRRKLQAPEWR